MGDLPFHADDQLIGQAWLWAAQNGEGKKAIAPIRAYFDHVLANRPTIGLEFIPVAPGKGTSTCTARWCWCDALFMAPPTRLRLPQAAGNRRYAHIVPPAWDANAGQPVNQTGKGAVVESAGTSW